ncbi:MAG: hypothetical protein WBB60_06060, partial [Nitrospira sp.]
IRLQQHTFAAYPQTLNASEQIDGARKHTAGILPVDNRHDRPAVTPKRILGNGLERNERAIRIEQ